jgi:hypothetical protein
VDNMGKLILQIHKFSHSCLQTIMRKDCRDSQGICKTWHQTWNIIAIFTMHHTTQCQHSNFLVELVLEDSGQRLNAAYVSLEMHACMRVVQ